MILGRVRSTAEAAASIDEAAARLVALLRTGTGRRWVGLYRVTATDVINLAWSGPAPPAHPVFPRSQGLTGAAIAARAAVRSDDVARDPRYLTNQATTGSELIVPVMLEGEVVGTLDIEEAHANAFRPSDERLFEAIAVVLSPLYRR